MSLSNLQFLCWFKYEILNILLSSLFQVTPESIQVQITPDGRPSGDALITFLSRGEAERAIAQRNKHTIGNRIIELFMV